MSYIRVLNSVLRRITPPRRAERELKRLAKRALRLAERSARRYKGRPMLVGSLTRGTWLMDKREFDVFILFPTSLSRKRLERLGLEIGKKIIQRLKGSYRIEYAEHPYVAGDVNGVNVDIVPCYAVASPQELKSAVDRTPFHVKYLEKNLKVKLARHVRLLKQFLSANRLYGADAKTQGFSGYLCELLIIKYGSFVKLAKAAVKWRPREVIDLEGYYKKEEYRNLRKFFPGQPLIVIDPTDKKRNVAAALSLVNFFRFKKYAKDFLQTPREELFFPRQIQPLTDAEFIRLSLERGTRFFLIKFSPPQVVPDILWPQLRKFAERLQNIVEETKYEFKVFGKDVYTDERSLALVLLEMEVSELPHVQKCVGPHVFDEKNSEAFIKAHRTALVGPYVQDGRWVVEIERKFKNVREKLIDSLSKPAEVLRAKGIPSYIADEIAKRFDVLDKDGIKRIVAENREVGVFLRRYFEKESLI